MLKTVIIQLTKANRSDSQPYDSIDGFDFMLEELKRKEVSVYFLMQQDYELPKAEIKKETNQETDQERKDRICDTILKQYNTSECLIICDRTIIIEICKKLQIPCIAYDNRDAAGQDLFHANMLVEGFEEVDYTFLEEVYQRFYHQPIIIARTSRLIIREMILDDLDELYALYSDETITRFLEPLYERQEEIEYTKAYIKNMYGFYGYGLWSLIDQQTGKLIGRAGLNNREIDGEIQIELGYMIGVAYQRQGYAFEACREILEFAVNRLECIQVNCFIDGRNEASIALVRKLGFRYKREIEIGDERLSWYRWTYPNSR